MQRRKASIFRTRNVRDRQEDDRAEKVRIHRDWRYARATGDDDEMRRLTAEYGGMYHMDSMRQIFAEAESEAIRDLDAEEVGYDEEDYVASGGAEWVKHHSKI